MSSVTTVSEIPLNFANQACDTEAPSNCFLELLSTIWKVIKSFFSCCFPTSQPVDLEVQNRAQKKRIYQETVQQAQNRPQIQLSTTDFRSRLISRTTFATPPNTTLIIKGVDRSLLEKLHLIMEQKVKERPLSMIDAILNQIFLPNGYCLKSNLSKIILVANVDFDLNALILSSSKSMKFEASQETLNTTIDALYASLISTNKSFTLQPNQKLNLIMYPFEIAKILVGGSKGYVYLMDFFHYHTPPNYTLQFANIATINIQRYAFKNPPNAVGLTLNSTHPVTLTLSRDS